MSVTGKLYQLQLLDTEWTEKDQRLAEVRQSLGVSGEVVRAQEDVEETQQGLRGLASAIRALELESGGVRDKLKANQDRLYSGKVRNPKELSNLHAEADALRRRLSELEDEQLELMMEAEEEEAELAERQARLRQIEETWRADQAALEAERARLEARLGELGELRTLARAQIPRAPLSQYDYLRAAMGGTAVALLKRGICQVCGVDVPTGMAADVERGAGEHSCPTCNRLLYGGG